MRTLSRGGETKLGCAVWLAILVVMVFIGWEAVPVKIAVSEFEDYMVETAQFAGRNTPDNLKRRLLKRAQDLDLPINNKNLTVEKSGGRVQMRAKFMVPLEFPGYTYEWNFDIFVDRPVFIV